MIPTVLFILCLGIALAGPIVAVVVYARREERVDALFRGYMGGKRRWNPHPGAQRRFFEDVT